MINASIYFGGGSNYSDGQIYVAARSGVMYIYVQSDWHTSVRCSQQYHQCNFGGNVYDGIIMYCFVGGITYGITPVWGTWSDPPTRVGIFCATPHSINTETPHILFSSSHFIYHQYNYGPINHDGLDGQFHISGFTKEGRNIGTWADPITRVGFISESWAPRDNFSIIVGSMYIIYFIMMIIKILEMKDYLLVVILLVPEV